MKNLFPFPRPFLAAVLVLAVASMGFSVHRLLYASTVSAFVGLVLSCTVMLAVLVVAAVNDALDVVKPLLQARVGSASTGSVGYPLPLTHRQNLEQGIANEVVRAALTPGFSSRAAGEKARTALDALTGAIEPVPRVPSVPTSGTVEARIDSAGLTAQRVTPADIEATIAAEYSFTLDKALAGCPLVDGLERVTLAVVVLRNGTKLVGVNYGAIDPARHDVEQGRVEARAAAVEQVWPLLGYELRTKLAG